MKKRLSLADIESASSESVLQNLTAIKGGAKDTCHPKTKQINLLDYLIWLI